MLVGLFGPLDRRGFAVRFWDGTVDTPSPAAAARFTLVLRHPAALRRMFLPPSEPRLAESFIRGDFDIEGDLEAAAALADELRVRLGAPAALARLIRQALALPRAGAPAPIASRELGRARHARRHSLRRDRAAIRSHYDVGDDFYRLWLDRAMVYSCAYFETGAEDIDAAQEAKLEHLCRKLRLRPGERLLDVGCGWGGLVRYAAERFGAHALGVTLSPAQAGYANARVVTAELGDRVAVRTLDYRELSEEAQFDKIVSVGMFEHVGLSRLAEYFGKLYRLLRPGGLFLNHGIIELRKPPRTWPARAARRLLWKEGSFIRRYVFPDGELVPLGEVVRAAEGAGFETRDLESLREHYALTLRHWVRRLAAARDAALALVGEQTYRTWILYMAASARAFTAGKIGVVQALFGKPDGAGRLGLPLTRADLYPGPPRPQ